MPEVPEVPEVPKCLRWVLGVLVVLLPLAAEAQSPQDQPKGLMPNLGRPTKPDDEVPLLDFDRYTITITAPGFIDAVQQINVVGDAGERREFVLQVAGVQETVSVSAAPESRLAPASDRRYSGRMFWFRWNTFAGSYRFLIARRRGRFGPYAASAGFPGSSSAR